MAGISTQHGSVYERLRQQLKDPRRELTNCRREQSKLQRRLDLALDSGLIEDAKDYSSKLRAQKQAVIVLETQFEESRQQLETRIENQDLLWS